MKHIKEYVDLAIGWGLTVFSMLATHIAELQVASILLAMLASISVIRKNTKK